MNVICPHCATQNRVPDARLLDAPNCGRCKSPLLPAEPFALDDGSFARYVQGTELPVLADFWADWCGPCKAMAPAFAQVARQRPEIRFVKVNSDLAPATAGAFRIRSIPTLVLLRGGREIARISGAMSAPQLESWIDAGLHA